MCSIVAAVRSVPICLLCSVQPLCAPHVRVSKGVYKNITIIATEFNSVYSFGAGALSVSRSKHNCNLSVISAIQRWPAEISTVAVFCVFALCRISSSQHSAVGMLACKAAAPALTRPPPAQTRRSSCGRCPSPLGEWRSPMTSQQCQVAPTAHARTSPLPTASPAPQ